MMGGNDGTESSGATAGSTEADAKGAKLKLEVLEERVRKIEGKQAGSNSLKPEAEEAKLQLEALESDMGNFRNKMREILNAIKRIESKDEVETTEAKEQHDAEMPKRFIFERLGMSFFVDFVLSATADEMAFEGQVIYGAVRTAAKPERDIEHKPLFECPVSRNGLIKDPSGIKVEKMLEDDGSNFADVHYLILRHIWKDALRWANDYPTE